MAKNIKQIAEGLGAKIVGQVSNAPGMFGAARVAHDTAALSDATGSESEFLGSMREDADLLDEIVEDAMRRRQVSGSLPSKEDFAALESMAEETGLPLNKLLDEAVRLLLERRAGSKSA